MSYTRKIALTSTLLFYDIRAYFQGRDEKGKMNNASSDEEYMRLLQDLRAKQKVLAKRIEQKVYEYGFLK